MFSVDALKRIAQEAEGVALDFSSATYNLDLELRFETSDNPAVALNRMVRVIIKLGIPRNAGEDLLRFLLLANNNWRTVSTSAWKEKVRRWWKENYREYGFKGLPGLPEWDDER